MTTSTTRSYQFGLRSIFLLTAFVALALAMRDDALVKFLIYFACNAIACAVIFGVPLWLASFRDR